MAMTHMAYAFLLVLSLQHRLVPDFMLTSFFSPAAETMIATAHQTAKEVRTHLDPLVAKPEVTATE